MISSTEDSGYDAADSPVPAFTPGQRHPRGIRTLFFTEMWERMSYYGMRALLVLYMTAPASRGGMEMPTVEAAAVYGLYVCAVYLVALPGGWIADRLLGQQSAVLYGGIIIALGHFTLAIQSTQAFFLGLVLVILGTALLKPSASSVVGQLYPEGGARRDAGFTLFYMGVNLGAFLGPLICGWLGERVSWHWGFAAAGVGMLGGVIQFTLTRSSLGDAGRYPPQPSTSPVRDWSIIGVALAAAGLFTALAIRGMFTINAVVVAENTSNIIATVALGWFVWMFFFGRLSTLEKKRLGLVAVLVVSSALFWSGFEQAGSTMNLFAEHFTERHLFGTEVPAEWFQSVNPVFVILFAPVFSWGWLRLARGGWRPSVTTKFAAGLLLLACAFLVMHFGSEFALAQGHVAPWWLVVTYLLLTWGELSLSPVGLSAVTKLAPERFTSQTMGIWFLATSLGNLLAGRLAGKMSGENAHAMPSLFLQIVMTAGGAGLLLACFSRPLRKLAGGAE